MKPVIMLVEGTFGGDNWANKKAPFHQMLVDAGFTVIRFRGWSGAIDGVPWLTRWTQKGKHTTWIAGGYAFADCVRLTQFAHPGSPISVIGHSHAVNLVIYGIIRAKDDGYPITLNRFLSVCSPIRADMQDQARGAAQGITQWRQVSSHGGDPMQRLGQLFDGEWGWNAVNWEIPSAPNVTNMQIANIGHSKLLTDPSQFYHWTEGGLLDFLRVPSSEIRVGMFDV